MWEYNYTPEPNELYHWGIKGMKWGVRRYQNPDGTLTPAGKRRKKIIDNEIDFQNNKIKQYESAAKAYRDSAKQVRKEGPAELRKEYPDMSDETIKTAVDTVAKRRENEARWNEHVAKHMKLYNKKLSEIDVTNAKMGRLKIHMLIQTLGKETANEINNTWKENG